MNAGGRRARVTLIERVPSPGALGPSFTETVGSELWAQLVLMSSGERGTGRYRGQSQSSEDTAAQYFLAFAGRPTINYSTTEFSVDGLRLQPTQNPLWSRVTKRTTITCKDVTAKR